MKQSTVVGMIVSPIITYIIVLVWAFVDDTLIDGSAAGHVASQLSWVIAHSFSLGHLLIFLVTALPAVFVPAILGVDAPIGRFAGVRWFLAICLMSLIPIGLGGFIFHGPTAIAVGLACGVASVLASYFLSAHRRLAPKTLLNAAIRLAPAETPVSGKPTFGRR